MKYFLLSSFLFISLNTIAQHGVSLNYTTNYIGHDIDLNYNYKFKKSKIILGISVLLNRDWVNNPNWEAYYKIFHSFDFIDRFGYKVGYNYLIPLKNKKTTFYASYDLRYRYGQTRNIIPIVKLDSLGNRTNQFIMEELVSTKIHAFSNIIGCGFSTNLSDNIFVNVRGGVGFDTFYTTQVRNKYTSANFRGNIPPLSFFNLSYLFSIGLNYQFPIK